MPVFDHDVSGLCEMGLTDGGFRVGRGSMDGWVQGWMSGGVEGWREG